MTTLDSYPSLDSPAVVIDKLSAIEADLAERQNEYEEAAAEVQQNKREYERFYALEHVKTRGTVEDRKQATLVALWLIDDGMFMTELVAAEAKLEGAKAALRVLEQRASINQSVLKKHTRETFGRAA